MSRPRQEFFDKHGGQWRYNRNNQLKREYGITLDKYNELVSLQCGACAICGDVPCENPDAGRNQWCLHVDHDHETGVIRGLICSNCNRAMGLLKDDLSVLQRMLAYLADRG